MTLMLINPKNLNIIYKNHKIELKNKYRLKITGIEKINKCKYTSKRIQIRCGWKFENKKYEVQYLVILGSSLDVSTFGY